MGKTNIPKSITIKHKNYCDIQNYHNLMKTIEKMVIYSLKEVESDCTSNDRKKEQ